MDGQPLNIPTRLICKQTKGGMYDSHPLAYFGLEDNEDEVIAFYQGRGHNEGLTNWYALRDTVDSGIPKEEIE